MSAYTPGPWSVLQPRANFETHPNMLLIVSKDADIAQVFQNTWDDTAQADAKLIAAAPDLLAALQAVAAMAEHQPAVADALGFQQVRAIRAALAKAGAA